MVWYKYEYAMDIAEPFEINTPNLERKLLIATQGSEFKNGITNGLVNHYKQDSIYIKIVDISALPEIDPNNYTALVVMHTWENWSPPEDVMLFIGKTKPFKNKIIVLTTSGKGSFKMESVDALTGESKLDNVISYTNQIIERLNPLLKPL